MTMRRRIFLKGIASTLALASVAAKKKPVAVSDIPFDKNFVSVLLGPSFDGQAEFSIVHAQPQTLRYLVFHGDQQIEEVHYSTIASPVDDFKIDKFLLRNLPLETDLALRIYAGDKKIDERIFSSIPSNRGNYDIGLVSCMRAGQHDKNMWNSLESQKSDLLLFLGDCVYIDYNLEEPITTGIIWKKFIETRMVLQFYKWKRLVPVVAIWDDHDFGGDNSNMSFRFLKETQENFKNFFAQNLSESSFISAGPGISTKFQLGNQLFLMLDGRSFREAPNSGKLYSFFGKEQEDWIFESIKGFNGLIWMNNGTQWFNFKGYGESFCKDHRISFNMFVEKLNQENKKVIFTSGDVHFSEVCETPKLIKNKSLEITSSCMHSSNFFGLPAMSRSENRVASAWNLNYIICKTSDADRKIAVEIRCFTKNAKKLFGTKTEFSVG